MTDPFGPELWVTEGGDVAGMAGFVFPTRMVVIRLASGGLMLWSPVALTDQVREAVAALGTPRFILAPNALHHLHVADWQAAFPGVEVHAAPGVSARRPDLDISAELEATPDPRWAQEVDQVLMENRIATEVVFFHRPSATVIFTDLLQNMAPGRFTGWRGVVARLDRMVGPKPAVPRKFRMGFRDRAAARDGVRQILDWPAQRLLLAHGTPLREGAQAAVENAFGWLRP
ncbi:DUF4336 domain-containing protein [Allosediminivita pacifica]|uniref:Uncharacterized protein DUF4336 n=1 Tax=Allosediminivita pacifica TaxID=1267769 RepID=A0A2T6A1E5_9RHOB|nr:DUF4336 domain-containing protein [Allosediminivita pacifica]PTX37651.1 uncharacterized protein DUF4336 [Allosediminivita pacifica]GGB29781.1 hypothetical protein GCM10011324_44150 [Allosediminivita pacifica]